MLYCDLDEFLASLGSCVLWHCYRRGDLRDRSGEGNHGTVLGEPKWKRSPKGHILHPNHPGDGGVQVVDAASLRLSDLSMLFFGEGFRWAHSDVILAKRDAGGCAYQMYWGGASTNYILLTDGTATDGVLCYAGVPLRMIGASVVSGSPGVYYRDGAYLGTGSTPITPKNDDAPIGIGRYQYATTMSMEHGGFSDVMLFNEVLTSEEIGHLWKLWQQAAHIDVRPTRRRTRVSVPKEYQATSRALRVQLGPPVNGVCPDLSGRGNVCTLSQPVNTCEAIFDRALEFHGRTASDGKGTIAAGADINTPPNLTVACWIRADSVGAVSGRLFEKGQWGVYCAAAVYDFYASYADGIAYWRVTHPTFGLWHHLAIAWPMSDGSTPPTVYIDGVAVNVTTVQARSGAQNSDAASALTLGNQSTLGREWDGTIEDFRVYASLLDATAVREIYLEGARRLLLGEPRTAHPVSVAAVTAGEVGPWAAYSGSWKWTDDGASRGLEAQANGSAAVMPQRHAFGSWYFRATKAADGNVLDLDVILTERGSAYLPATNDGYVLRMHSDESVYLWKATNGAWAGTIFTSAASYIAIGVEYEFLLTRRRSDYTFALWIRGGAYTSWTQVGSGIDSTYATSVWCAVDGDSGDQVRDFRHYQSEMTADEFEELGLAEAA